MDRFLFHNSQYKLLDAVRNEPWVGIPVPFAECAFEFLDTGLHVNTYILHGGGILRTTYSQFSSKENIIPLGCAEIPLCCGRWPEKISINAWDSLTAPPDCVYEFLRFYQRLSVYLAQPKLVTALPAIEGPGTAYSASQKSDGAVSVRQSRDRVISLEPLSAKEQAAAFHIDPHERKKQLHPCTYEFWVRGHMRHYKSGITTWIDPFKKNKGKPEKSKTYSLKEAE